MTRPTTSLTDPLRSALDGTLRRRRLRAARHLAEHARRAGVTSPALSRWENGVRPPRTSTSLRLIALFQAIEEVRHAPDAA